MTQRKITHEERLRHVEAVRRVAAVALLPYDPRVQRNCRDVLDFLLAHIEELPESAGRMAVPMAADYVHRGTLISRRTVASAFGTLADLGMIVRVSKPSDRTATVWTIPTDLGERAASSPPVAANYWTTGKGREYRHAGAALTADQAAADREARLRREAAKALRGRGAVVTDETITAEIDRLSAQSLAQRSAQTLAQSPAQSSAQSLAPKIGDTTSLRSAAVGSADGLGASGTTALPRSDGDGDDAGTTNDATITDPRTDADGMRLPAENDAQRRADTQGGAPAQENPWLALREQAKARKATEEGHAA